MPTVITPAPALLPATITGPQDLVDLRTAASVNQAFQPLANACGYYQEIITVRRLVSCSRPCLGTVAATAKSQTIVGPLLQIPATGALLYEPWATGIEFDDVDNAAANGRHLIFPLDNALIHGATITSAKLRLKGVNAHGALPLMMPGFSVMRYDAATDTLASLRAAGMVDDTSANVAAYEVIHSITFTPDQNNVIDREQDYMYWGIVCNEGNTNAQPNLHLYGIQLTMSARRFAAGVTT